MTSKRRRFPSSKGTKRNAPVINLKQLIIIVCEGGNTEPKYFSDFARFYGNALVKLDITGGSGAPRTIVEKAIERKKEQLKIARKTGEPSNSFQVWAVFDVDEHPKISEAKDLAKSNKIHIGISNPCIEIWGIFHYERHTAHIERHPAQKKLAELMVNYDHDSGAYFDFNEIKDDFDKAKKNAQHLETRHTSGGSPIDKNPSSNIYKLLDEIIKYGREEP